MIKYTQFIQVVHRTQQESYKAQIRKAFNRYDERRLESTTSAMRNVKPGLLNKGEITKLLAQVTPESLITVDRLFEEWDKDRDQQVNLEETMSMFISIASNYI